LDGPAQVGCGCSVHIQLPPARRAAHLILRWKGRPGYTLLTAEGITQGDPLSMVLRGLALAPLADILRSSRPGWYIDNLLLQGLTSAMAAAMAHLQRLGRNGLLPRTGQEHLRPLSRRPSGGRRATRSLQLRVHRWQPVRRQLSGYRSRPLPVAHAPNHAMGPAGPTASVPPGPAAPEK
jgi:hypothetical protein